jgi:hypothetical protein
MTAWFSPSKEAGQVPNWNMDISTPRLANQCRISVLVGGQDVSAPHLATAKGRLYFHVVAICCPLTALQVLFVQRICEEKLVQYPIRTGNSIANCYGYSPGTTEVYMAGGGPKTALCSGFAVSSGRVCAAGQDSLARKDVPESLGVCLIAGNYGTQPISGSQHSRHSTCASLKPTPLAPGGLTGLRNKPFVGGRFAA